MEFELNGQPVRVAADDIAPGMPLLWVLRDVIGLTGTKYACGIGACGTCTVHLDGRAVLSCVIPVEAVQGRRVRTIEGLGEPDAPHALQQAWAERQVSQCGYCQPGMLMAAAALLAARPTPTDAEVDEALAVLCRCGTYQRVREAVRLAAQRMQPGPTPASPRRRADAAPPGSTRT